MKKIVLFLAVFFSLLLQAQPPKSKEKKEKLKALKTAYISTELNLTPEEATKFWPIYHAFEDKQHEIKQEKWKRYLDANESSLNELSTKEASALLQKVEHTEENTYQERKKFVQNLKEFLPAIKILKLLKAEASFNRKLLQQFRNKKDPK
jgi:Spy/CpxP family protein refolding chaperone